MEYLEMIEDLLCKFCDFNPDVLTVPEFNGCKTR